MELFSDEYYMNEALKQAQIAFEEGEIPVGAVIVSKNRIIARAYNQTEKLNDVTAHAEMIAITSAANYLGAKYLPECKLYGAEDPKRGFRETNAGILHPKTELQGGLLAQESEKLLLDFFKKLRN